MTGRRLTIADIAHLPTVTVPVAGQVLGIGRDAAYAAAARGELPVLRLGRSLRCPVPRLLELLGVTPESSEAAPASTATRSDIRPLKAINRYGHFDPPAA